MSSMDNDPRTGYYDSGTVTIASGDGNTPQTALQIPSDALFKLTEIKIEYDDGAGTTADLQVFDDADGTSAGNVSDLRDTFLNLDGDMQVIHDADYRDFEEDVLVATENGNQDADLEVTVHGYVLTDLEDMVGMS